MPIRVLLCDEQPLVRTGLHALLTASVDIEVVGEAGDGFETLALARSLRPDVVVTDIAMPGPSPWEVIRELVRPAEDAGAAVLVITDLDDSHHMLNTLRAGARGFFLKHEVNQDLADAVRALAAGQALLAASVTRRVLDLVALRLPMPSREAVAMVATLTERERQILELVARGRSNPEIAKHLSISEATVKSHFHNLRRKLRLGDRAQAVAFAHQHGFIEHWE